MALGSKNNNAFGFHHGIRVRSRVRPSPWRSRPLPCTNFHHGVRSYDTITRSNAFPPWRFEQRMPFDTQQQDTKATLSPWRNGGTSLFDTQRSSAFASTMALDFHHGVRSVDTQRCVDQPTTIGTHPINSTKGLSIRKRRFQSLTNSREQQHESAFNSRKATLSYVHRYSTRKAPCTIETTKRRLHHGV